MNMIRKVALAICRSRTCEGASCCQWPANMGRHNCNAKQGAYDDAAIAAINALREPTDRMIEASNREWDGRMSYRSSGAWQAMIDAAVGQSADGKSDI